MSNTVKTPWLAFMGEIPATMEYPKGSMYDCLSETAHAYPEYIAFDFMGKSTTYSQLIKKVDLCAKSLKALGVKENDRITVAMPNSPQAVAMFYAINKLGAVSNMIHPLSAEKEIEFYLNEAHSEIIVTLDQFYSKIEAVRKNVKLSKAIIASVKDELPFVTSLGYALTQGRKIKQPTPDGCVVLWNDFLRGGEEYADETYIKRTFSDDAVILYSGGTTGKTKGIVLTNGNFNALGKQIIATNQMFTPGDKMLAAMPVFHGFGLGVCIHSMLINGGRCVLVPRFTPQSYAKLITKCRCQFIAGVPTLYEALLRLPTMEKADLSCLKGVFSGGDSLSIELKKKLDTFLADHNCSIRVREGYGTTETVTACCLTPTTLAKEGSIGIPFPDTFIKIVKPDTAEELPYGEEGEILLSAPTVMKCYLDQPEETAKTLRTHEDGKTWVYTGDLGIMDSDGFVFFKGRAKRMIITSGYNVYPNQIENILDASPLVHMSCVIGVKDELRVQKVKAFIMLKPDVPATEETKQQILEYCSKNIAKYAMPREIEFRDELPKTLVGKVAYRQLEEEVK